MRKLGWIPLKKIESVSWCQLATFFSFLSVSEQNPVVFCTEGPHGVPRRTRSRVDATAAPGVANQTSALQILGPMKNMVMYGWAKSISSIYVEYIPLLQIDVCLCIYSIYFIYKYLSVTIGTEVCSKTDIKKNYRPYHFNHLEWTHKKNNNNHNNYSNRTNSNKNSNNSNNQSKNNNNNNRNNNNNTNDNNNNDIIINNKTKTILIVVLITITITIIIVRIIIRIIRVVTTRIGLLNEPIVKVYWH